MNTATTLLHDMRGQQMRALADFRSAGGWKVMTPMHCDSIIRYADLCGAQYDTRNLSDKALEEVDALAGRYLERAR